ncbi:hypothetical protein HPG69_003238 [Diceros bicornis minor]|uniref:Uncharacterized protein n=1 Tax=Diceros bicornis minor TaxID=77932 RepID=A0A7J7FB73_DICBM|nr:hypothetical protein HPG69_003238 [Diceros bicornis minor]
MVRGPSAEFFLRTHVQSSVREDVSVRDSVGESKKGGAAGAGHGAAAQPPGRPHLCGPLAARPRSLALPTSWLQDGRASAEGRATPFGRVFSQLLVFLPLLILRFCWDSCSGTSFVSREPVQVPPQATAHILKALRLVTANLATFMVCFLPLHVALLATLVAQRTNTACPLVQRVVTFGQMASHMANASCCRDAVGCYFVATEFQEEVGAILAMP